MRQLQHPASKTSEERGRESVSHAAPPQAISKFHQLQQLHDRTIERRQEFLNARSCDTLVATLREADEGYHGVDRPREQAVDAATLVAVAQYGATKLERMRLATEDMDAETFAGKLHLRYLQGGGGSGGRDLRGSAAGSAAVVAAFSSMTAASMWTSVGAQALRFLFAYPRFDGLFGPIAAERQHAPRSARQRDAIGEKIVPLAGDDDGEGPELQRCVDELGQQIGAAGSVRLLDLVVDPDSYSVSIERLFHLAFLVREGLARTYLGDSDEIFLTLVPEDQQGTISSSQSDASSSRVRQHSVLRLDHDTWATEVRRKRAAR